MTLTMHEGNDNSYVMLCTKDERIYKYPYANYDGYRTYWVSIDTKDFYNEIVDLASFVNNTLGEEFSIEID